MNFSKECHYLQNKVGVVNFGGNVSLLQVMKTLNFQMMAYCFGVLLTLEEIVQIQVTHTYMQELLIVAVAMDVVGMVVVGLHLLQIA